MRRYTHWIVLSGCVLGLAQAQNPMRGPTSDEEMRRRELLLREMESAPAAAEVAERRRAESREREFVDKANRFARLWTQFATEYNQRKTFNVKTARELSKAFRELEQEGWPKPVAK